MAKVGINASVMVDKLADEASTIGAIFKNMVGGDRQASDKAWSDLFNGGSTQLKRIQEEAKAAKAEIDKVRDAALAKVDRHGKSEEEEKYGPMFGPAAPPKGDTLDPDDLKRHKKPKSDKLLEDWAKDLEDRKMLEENWFTWDKAQELKFWEDKLATVAGKGKEYEKAQTKAEKEINKLRKDIRTDQLAAEKKDIQDQVKAETDKIDLEIDAIKTGTKRKAEAIDALEGKAEGKKAAAPGGIGGLLAGQEELKTLETLEAQKKKLYADELAAVIALEREKLDVKLQGYALDLQQQGITEARKKEIIGQVKQAQRDFDKVVQKETEANQAKGLADERNFAKKRTEIEKDAAKTIGGYMDPFVKGFMGGLGKMLDGTITFAQAVGGLGKMLLQAFSQVILSMVEAWIEGLAHQAAAWVAHLLFKETTEKASDAASVATGVATRTAQAEGQAALLGLNAAASAAAVPVVGWLAWPGAMAAALAAGQALVPMAAAAGGFDIPAGLNPITQLHSKEMVLPADLADRVRGMTGGGGDTHVHISAMDSRSFEQSLRTHGSSLNRVLKDNIRNGKFGRVGRGGGR